MTAYLKYRPTSLDEMVLPESLKLKLQMMSEKDDIQPMLFYGKPGTGKSLTASLLSENNFCFRCDSVEYSPTETLKMAREAGRNKNLWHLDTRRLIILDEIDRWRVPEQEKARALIDDYGHLASFVATTNHIDEVIPALQSRLSPICFDVEAGNLILVSKWKQRLMQLHVKHFATHIEDRLLNAALTHFPDARRMISTVCSGIP